MTQFKLRVGHAILEPAAGASARANAIEQFNSKVRLEGLPDHLNPQIVDLQKAEALLQRIPNLPPETTNMLAGKILYLNSPGLLIGASAPTSVTSFSKPFKLESIDVQGELIIARVTLEPDCQLARSRASEARTRLKAAEDEVKALETKSAAAVNNPEEEHRLLVSLSAARSRRYAIASVWHQNAVAWAGCNEADSTAKADVEAASKALNEYLVPSGIGMP